jgi:ADP-ribose pyrophosphatase YjhB (NUDIX family)
MSYIPDKIYNVILKNTVISCVDVCIRYDNKILLIKRSEEPELNQWYPIGGRIHIGESIFKAAKRIAKEECNLNIIPIKIIHSDNTIFKDKDKNIIRHSLNIVVLADVKNIKNFKLDNKSSEYKWESNIRSCYKSYVNNCFSEALNYE